MWERGVGYSVVIYVCIVEDEVFVGMGVIFMDGVVVEKGVFVVVGLLVIENICIFVG